MQKNLFWITLLFRKISGKITFDFEGLYIAAKEVFWGKLVVLRYSLAPTSIFIIKVDLSPKTDILNNGNVL
jgi:hypothetical protein